MNEHDNDVEELKVKMENVRETIRYLIWILEPYISDEAFKRIVAISNGRCTAQEAKGGPHGKG